MKSLTLLEVAQLAISAQDMVGAHLQDVFQTTTELGLGFYHERESVWLWLDLNPQRPMLARFRGRAPKRKKLMRPLTLFLRSNFSGRRLASIRADLDKGRIITLGFSRSREEESENPGPCEIEIRLFPRGQNVIARNGKKSVAETKPKDLALAGKTTFGESFLLTDNPLNDVGKNLTGGASTDLNGGASTDLNGGPGIPAVTVPKTVPKTVPENFLEKAQASESAINTERSFAFLEDRETARTWEQLTEAWEHEQRLAVSVKKDNQTSDQTESVASPTAGLQAGAQEAARILKEFERALQKKQIALERMHDEVRLKSTEAETYRLVGDQLKLQGTLECPIRDEPWSSLWPTHVDLERSLSWNIENTFTKAKERKRKLSGTQDRLAVVEKELIALRAKGPSNFVKKKEKDSRDASANLLSKSDARGRRLTLSEGLEIYVGKSAADNLALLRKAQSFDYWLHLRDQPGSHAIMRRSRNRVVTDNEFLLAGQWVIEQSLGVRAAEHKGQKFDMLIVECRFVRPIKGDRLGRVNYANDRVLSVRYR